MASVGAVRIVPMILVQGAGSRWVTLKYVPCSLD
jgi:hypothetical protein